MGSNNQYHVRSISLPSRNHPNTNGVEEELNKIKSWEATSMLSFESIQSGLEGLVNLHLSLDDFLNMASTQQALSMSKTEKCIDELLDESVKLLDICGITRELVLQIKEHVQRLQSALRRRKGDSSIETPFKDFTNFRKKMKKDAKKLITTLTQMDKKIKASSSLLELDSNLVPVIRVLTEVSMSSSFIFQSLLSLFSATATKKPTKWSILSRLVHKGAIASEEIPEARNQLVSLDASLIECIDTKKIQTVQEQLGSLEISISSLDDCLGCIFRRFVKTRASLLNMISS